MRIYAGSSDQIFAHGPHRRLRAVGNADLSQNVLHVFFHRFVADAKRLGDFLVRQSERELFQYLAFTLGERYIAVGTVTWRRQRARNAWNI